jgi:hypothetical protein
MPMNLPDRARTDPEEPALLRMIRHLSDRLASRELARDYVAVR